MKSMGPFPMEQELSICTERLMIVYESAELGFLEIRSQIAASVQEVVQALSSCYHIQDEDNEDEESEDVGSLDERLYTC